MRLILGLLIVAETVALLANPPLPTPLAELSPKVATRAAIAPPRRTPMQALQGDVERLRNLRYKHDVIEEKRTRGQLRKYLREQLAKEDMKPEEVMLQAFGLIPPASRLADLVLQLYTAQVAGFYEPSTQRFYMVEDRPTGMLGSLTGGISSTFNTLSGTTEIMMIHELDHALTDQHFNLNKFMHQLSTGKPGENDDEDIARQAVVEGDATMVMMHAQWQQMGLDFGFQRIDGAQLTRMTEMLSWIPGMSQQGLDEAPLYLRRRLIFPYFYGAGFMDYLRRLGNDELNRAYTSPPRSTAEILHPFLYAQRHEGPLVTPKDMLPDVVDGWRLRATNVLGEFRMSVLFEQYLNEGPDAAAGWRGDRYWIYTHASNFGVLSASTWRSAQAARYAAQRFTVLLVKRHHLPVVPPMRTLMKLGPSDLRAAWTVTVDGREYSVVLDDTRLRVEDGVPPALARLWQAKAVEWAASP